MIMQYFSTNKNSPRVNFREAAIHGQPPDKGLYFPESIPVFPEQLIKNIQDYSNEEIAFEAIRPYIGDTIPEDILLRIVKETIDFPIPLVQVTNNISSLELYHGPTLAFKDIGARFMSRCLSYFVQGLGKKVTVLVATSGDTGGAVANGFYDVPGIDVVILYPSGKVSEVQEKQLTTLGKNIRALEVRGTFDDCQRMVKEAFADKELTDRLFLTSANSINVARWLPQQFYYFFAYKQWPDKATQPVISVPSGNFGNICAGVLAHASGLPVKHFIAACNANDAVPRFLASGNYAPNKAIATISNAMDVGDPSNFGRLLQIFSGDDDRLKKYLSATSITDEETRATIKKVFSENNYLLDPHGAVAWLALEEYLAGHPAQKGFILETAHPVKFDTVVQPLVDTEIPVPDGIKKQSVKEKMSVMMGNDYSELRDFLG